MNRFFLYIRLEQWQWRKATTVLTRIFLEENTAPPLPSNWGVIVATLMLLSEVTCYFLAVHSCSTQYTQACTQLNNVVVVDKKWPYSSYTDCLKMVLFLKIVVHIDIMGISINMEIQLIFCLKRSKPSSIVTSFKKVRLFYLFLDSRRSAHE